MLRFNYICFKDNFLLSINFQFDAEETVLQPWGVDDKLCCVVIAIVVHAINIDILSILLSLWMNEEGFTTILLLSMTQHLFDELLGIVLAGKV